MAVGQHPVPLMNMIYPFCRFPKLHSCWGACDKTSCVTQRRKESLAAMHVLQQDLPRIEKEDRRGPTCPLPETVILLSMIKKINNEGLGSVQCVCDVSSSPPAFAKGKTYALSFTCSSYFQAMTTLTKSRTVHVA